MLTEALLEEEIVKNSELSGLVRFNEISGIFWNYIQKVFQKR